MSNYQTVESKRVDIYNAAVSTLNLEYICFKSIYFAGGWGPSVVRSCCWSRWVSDTRGCGHFNNKLIIYWFHFKLRGDLFFTVGHRSIGNSTSAFFTFLPIHKQHSFYFFFLCGALLLPFVFNNLSVVRDLADLSLPLMENIEQSTKYIFAGIYQNMRFKLMLNLLLFNVNE